MKRQPSMSSGGIERTPFYGFLVPPEIKSFFKIKKAFNLEKNDWKNILNFVNQYLVEQNFSYDRFDELVTGLSLTEEEMKGVVSAMITVAKSAFRNPNIRQEHFEDDLRNLKFPEACIGIFLKMLFGANRAIIDASVVESRVSLPRFLTLKWRVDVTISNTLLQRALTPTILCELLLKNGSANLFEMSLDKFHQLRFNVALVLKEMDELDLQHKALKIA